MPFPFFHRWTIKKHAPSEDGACCVWDGSELLIQLDTVGIGVQGAGEQADEINKCPDAATDGGAAGQDDLDDAIFGVTQVEIVNTEVAQKEGQQDGDQLRLLTGCSTVQCVAAGKTNAGAGLGGLTAVMAEAGAGSLGKSAPKTDRSLGIDGSSTIFAIHNITSDFHIHRIKTR